MKLIKVPATETTPNLIDIYDNKQNKFACVAKTGELKLFGEDAIISESEQKDISVIRDNFDLFFNNIKN